MNCGTCLLERAELVPLNADGTCPNGCPQPSDPKTRSTDLSDADIVDEIGGW